MEDTTHLRKDEQRAEQNSAVQEEAGTEPRPVATTKSKRGPGWFATIVLCVFCSITSVLIYDHYFAQKFVAVDIKGYLATQRDLFLAKKITEEQLKQSIDHLGDVVDKIPKNKAVVMGDAVIRNVEVIKP